MALSATMRGSQNYMWDTRKPLGHGATSMVYLGRNKNTGDEVAVKVFTHAGNMRPADVQLREYSVMRKLKQENIVQLLDIEEEQGTYNKVIVMELSLLGSLYNMLEVPDNAFGIPEEEFLLVIKHVTAGMKHLRDNGIVHRDIKPGNILRYKADDGRSIYKLTDFGAARELEEEEQFMSLYGTEEYLHPDIYEKAVLRSPVRRHFDATVDLWSLGVTFYHVATGQLPFRPYGGRRNKDKMYEITTKKESGVISGVQKKDGGPIEWSREMPDTCHLSTGLKMLITPFLAGLLETIPEKVWLFDKLFKEVEAIVDRIVINVFSPLNWASLKVYISPEERLSRMQDLIAKQTEIPIGCQLLIYQGQQLKDIVDPMASVCTYPKSISLLTPIIVFHRTLEEMPNFPIARIPEYPTFGSSISLDNDFSFAKMCCGISHLIKREMERLHLKEDLVHRAVHHYVHELDHGITHLADYLEHLKKHCCTARTWQDTFFQQQNQEKKLLRMVQATTGDVVVVVERDMEESKVQCEECSKQAKDKLDTVSDRLDRLVQSELLEKYLLRQWRDVLGCAKDDRCIAKLDVLLETKHRILTVFKEDRQKRILNFNEEQIHKFEKNRLLEVCTKLRSLMQDKCMYLGQQQFAEFTRWYSKAKNFRLQTEEIDVKLSELSSKQEVFVQNMCEFSSRYLNRLDEKVLILTDSVKQLGSRQHGSKKRNGKEAEKQQFERRERMKQIVDGLQQSKEAMSETKRVAERNSQDLERINQLLESDPTLLKVEPKFPNG